MPASQICCCSLKCGCIAIATLDLIGGIGCFISVLLFAALLQDVNVGSGNVPSSLLTIFVVLFGILGMLLLISSICLFIGVNKKSIPACKGYLGFAIFRLVSSISLGGIGSNDGQALFGFSGIFQFLLNIYFIAVVVNFMQEIRDEQMGIVPGQPWGTNSNMSYTTVYPNPGQSGMVSSNHTFGVSSQNQYQAYSPHVGNFQKEGAETSEKSETA